MTIASPTNGPRHGASAAMTVTEGSLLFAAALFVRLATAVVHSFNGPYGQDAWEYIDRAQKVLDSGFALQALNDVYTMPVGYPFLIAAGSLATGSLIVAGQALALLGGAGMVPLVCAITRRLWPSLPRWTGWLAAGLVALCGQHVTWSIALMTDVPSAFFCTLSLWAMVRASEGERAGRWLALAGFALGIAWSIRWAWVAVAPSFGLAWLWLLWKKRLPLLHGLLPIVTGTLACLPQLIITLRHPEGLGIRWSGDWRPHNIIERSFYFAEGQYDYTWPMGVYYALPAVHPGWLTPIGGVAMLWGLAHCFRRGGHTFALTLLAGSSFCNWLMLSGMPHQNFRYGMQVWIFLVPFAAVGAAVLWRTASLEPAPSAAKAKRRALVATGLVASVVVSLWFVRAPAKLVRLAAQHRDTALALVKDLPPDTPVYALGPTAELAHRTSLKVRELFSETSAALAAQRARGGPIYLVYDPKAVARWRTGELPKTLQWLKSNGVREKINTVGRWTMWRIRWR